MYRKVRRREVSPNLRMNSFHGQSGASGASVSPQSSAVLFFMVALLLGSCSSHSRVPASSYLQGPLHMLVGSWMSSVWSASSSPWPNFLFVFSFPYRCVDVLCISWFLCWSYVCYRYHLPLRAGLPPPLWCLNEQEVFFFLIYFY